MWWLLTRLCVHANIVNVMSNLFKQILPKGVNLKSQEVFKQLKIQISADQIYFKIKYGIFSNDAKETTFTQTLDCHFGIA